MASEAAVIEKSGPGFMEPGDKIKKKRGPKGPWKNKEPEAPSVSQSQSPGLAPQTDPVSELLPVTNQLAIFYSKFLVQFAEDERAALNQETQNHISHASAVCLNQYFPDAMGKHAALVVLLCIVGQTSFTAYTLRSQNLEKLKDQKRRQEAQRPQKSSAQSFDAGLNI